MYYIYIYISRSVSGYTQLKLKTIRQLMMMAASLPLLEISCYFPLFLYINIHLRNNSEVYHIQTLLCNSVRDMIS